MYLPPTGPTIIAGLSIALAMTAMNYAPAQQADYNRRLAAMQSARTQSAEPQQLRVASAATRENYSHPPEPPVARRLPAANAQRNQAPTRSIAPQSGPSVAPNKARPGESSYGSKPVASRYSPAHLRTAQLHDEVITHGGSPIMRESVITSGRPVVGNGSMQHASPAYGSYETIVDDGYIDDGYYDEGYVDEGYYEEGGTSTCGECGGFFEAGRTCSDRGGCPPGDCWLSGLGGILYKGDYFAGAQGFQNALFAHPDGSGALLGGGNFGFYGGMNFGIPLCKLTCGVLSGQFGVRSVQSNFHGNDFSSEDRNQTFYTMGLYRRVDYGLQFGVVADVLHEDYFTETTTVQIRTDLGWVWANGTTFGFRYADNTQDDIEPGTIDGVTYNAIRTRSEDWYRFYLRKDASVGGYGEMFFGWTDAHQTIFGMNTDLPITERLSAQSTFTYYLDDEQVPAISGRQGGNLGDAWNVAVGFAFHPQGRSYYKSYDRPLFNVADNGSMLITRE